MTTNVIWDSFSDVAPPIGIPLQHEDRLARCHARDNWTCTAIKGHAGPHAAYTPDDILKCVWTDKTTGPYFDPHSTPYHKDHQFSGLGIAAVNIELMYGTREKPVNIEVYDEGLNNRCVAFLTLDEARQLVMDMIDQIKDAELREQHRGGA